MALASFRSETLCTTFYTNTHSSAQHNMCTYEAVCLYYYHTTSQKSLMLGLLISWREMNDGEFKQQALLFGV